jgi:hypothetical protein
MGWAFEGYLVPCPFVLCFLAAMRWATHFCHNILPHLRPEAVDLVNLGLKLRSIDLSSFSCSDTCHSNRNLINTVGLLPLFICYAFHSKFQLRTFCNFPLSCCLCFTFFSWTCGVLTAILVALALILSSVSFCTVSTDWFFFSIGRVHSCFYSYLLIFIRCEILGILLHCWVLDFVVF